MIGPSQINSEALESLQTTVLILSRELLKCFIFGSQYIQVDALWGKGYGTKWDAIENVLGNHLRTWWEHSGNILRIEKVQKNQSPPQKPKRNRNNIRLYKDEWWMNVDEIGHSWKKKEVYFFYFDHFLKNFHYDKTQCS